MNAGGPDRGLTAVVLAAGVNRRMGEAPLPKSFLSLTADGSGPTFLERHVAVLRELNVNDVAIVLSEPVHERVAPIDGSRYVVNRFDTSSSGSTLSLLSAIRDSGVAAHDGLLIMDADIVYEKALLRFVVDAGDDSVLFVSPTTAGDDEEVRVFGNGPTPTLIGKGLGATITEGMDLYGESLGVIHVAAEDREFLTATCEWLAGWPPETEGYGYAKVRSEHEEVWQYFFAAGRMNVAATPSDLLFSECDTPADYRHVTHDLFASITTRDASRDRP